MEGVGSGSEDGRREGEEGGEEGGKVGGCTKDLLGARYVTSDYM